MKLPALAQGAPSMVDMEMLKVDHYCDSAAGLDKHDLLQATQRRTEKQAIRFEKERTRVKIWRTQQQRECQCQSWFVILCCLPAMLVVVLVNHILVREG